MEHIGIEELIAFWNDFEPTAGTGQVHQSDAGTMANVHTVMDVHSVGKYFDEYLSIDCDDFHTSLSPVPYLGDLRSADMFLLMLNPSAGYADYCTDAAPTFRTALARTLKQDFKQGAGTCLALNPELCCGNSWFLYYERLLRRALLDYAGKVKSYTEALCEISHRLAIIELVPYYSPEAGQIRKVVDAGLPSALKARRAGKELMAGAKQELVEIHHRNGLGEKARKAVVKRLQARIDLNMPPLVIVRKPQYWK